MAPSPRIIFCRGIRGRVDRRTSTCWPHRSSSFVLLFISSFLTFILRLSSLSGCTLRTRPDRLSYGAAVFFSLSSPLLVGLLRFHLVYVSSAFFFPCKSNARSLLGERSTGKFGRYRPLRLSKASERSLKPVDDDDSDDRSGVQRDRADLM